MKTPSKSKPRALKLAEDDYVYCVISTVGGGVTRNSDRIIAKAVWSSLGSGAAKCSLRKNWPIFRKSLFLIPPKLVGRLKLSVGPRAHILCVRNSGTGWRSSSPDGRSFYPIHVRSTRPIKGVTDHGTYYLIVRPPVIDAIIPEGTIFWGGGTGVGEIGPDGRFGLSALKDAPCYIRREAVEGHHLWYLNGGGDHMFSAELLRRYRAHKVRGLDVTKKCILK